MHCRFDWPFVTRVGTARGSRLSKADAHQGEATAELGATRAPRTTCWPGAVVCARVRKEPDTRIWSLSKGREEAEGRTEGHGAVAWRDRAEQGQIDRIRYRHGIYRKRCSARSSGG